MATTSQHYKAKIDFRRRGGLPAPRFRIAVREALRQVAQPILATTRQLADQRTKHSPSLTNRGTRRYPQRMRDRYDARVLADGKTLSLYNPLLRGKIFEVSSRAHPIRPRHKRMLQFRNRQGQMVRSLGVMHPGTRAQYPMRDALNAHLGRIEDSLDRELSKQLKGFAR